MGFRIYGMSVERLEVAASGLSFVMSTFPVLIGQEKEEKEPDSKKRDKEEIKKGTAEGRKKIRGEKNTT